jgi:glucose/arabinose dehydrogenase
MRCLLGLLLVACGNPPAGPKDADPIPIDPPIDAGLPACANPVSGSTVSLRQINRTRLGAIPTIATSPPLDPRLFVVRIDGVIWIFKDEVQVPTPFVDLSDDSGGPVVAGGEMGLLGIAFHPQYATNGLFFVYYTAGDVTNGTLRDVISRCSVDAANPDLADPSSCVELLSIPDPATNHNGGMMEFGKDGYLYAGTGDGGGPAAAPRSQDLNLLLGKMLRIDVDHKAPGKEYGIPADNPFAAGGGLPEIYMLGLRNPWRWSFDRVTHDMWIGDVGGGAWEELDVLVPGEQKGANLGWSMYEAHNCPSGPCVPEGKVFPLDERSHGGDGWGAIIAGEVYRGTCYPDLVGWHFYSDNVAGGLVKARLRPDHTLEVVDLVGAFPTRVASIHSDARGELYMTNIDGFLFHLEAGP